MDHRHRRSLQLLLAAAFAGSFGPAAARNDKLLLPIDPALRTRATQQVLAGDVALRFGKASAAGAATVGAATVHSVADPLSSPNSAGQRRRREDEVVCLDAFRKALVELQAQARANGVTAVVGIVSNYNGIEMDSPSAYECHIGHTRGVVHLKGQFARGAPPLAASAPPAPTEAPGQPARIASGFAAIALYAVNGAVVWNKD